MNCEDMARHSDDPPDQAASPSIHASEVRASAKNVSSPLTLVDAVAASSLSSEALVRYQTYKKVLLASCLCAASGSSNRPSRRASPTTALGSHCGCSTALGFSRRNWRRRGSPRPSPSSAAPRTGSSASADRHRHPSRQAQQVRYWSWWWSSWWYSVKSGVVTKLYQDSR